MKTIKTNLFLALIILFVFNLISCQKKDPFEENWNIALKMVEEINIRDMYLKSFSIYDLDDHIYYSELKTYYNDLNEPCIQDTKNDKLFCFNKIDILKEYHSSVLVSEKIIAEFPFRTFRREYAGILKLPIYLEDILVSDYSFIITENKTKHIVPLSDGKIITLYHLGKSYIMDNVTLSFTMIKNSLPIEIIYTGTKRDSPYTGQKNTITYTFTFTLDGNFMI